MLARMLYEPRVAVVVQPRWDAAAEDHHVRSLAQIVQLVVQRSQIVTAHAPDPAR